MTIINSIIQGNKSQTLTCVNDGFQTGDKVFVNLAPKGGLLDTTGSVTFEEINKYTFCNGGAYVDSSLVFGSRSNAVNASKYYLGVFNGSDYNVLNKTGNNAEYFYPLGPDYSADVLHSAYSGAFGYLEADGFKLYACDVAPTVAFRFENKVIGWTSSGVYLFELNTTERSLILLSSSTGHSFSEAVCMWRRNEDVVSFQLPYSKTFDVDLSGHTITVPSVNPMSVSEPNNTDLRMHAKVGQYLVVKQAGNTKPPFFYKLDGLSVSRVSTLESNWTQLISYTFLYNIIAVSDDTFYASTNKGGYFIKIVSDSLMEATPDPINAYLSGDEVSSSGGFYNAKAGLSCCSDVNAGTIICYNHATKIQTIYRADPVDTAHLNTGTLMGFCTDKIGVDANEKETIDVGVYVNNTEFTVDVTGGIGTSIHTWTQPVLTSNGTVGSGDMAVYSNDGVYSSFACYKPFSSTSGQSAWWLSARTNPSTSNPITYCYWTKSAIKVSSFSWVNRESNAEETVGNFTFQGSYDGVDWDDLASFENNDRTAGATLTFEINSNNYYNYHRLLITSAVGGSTSTRVSFGKMTINADYREGHNGFVDISKGQRLTEAGYYYLSSDGSFSFESAPFVGDKAREMGVWLTVEGVLTIQVDPPDYAIKIGTVKLNETLDAFKE